MRRPLTWVEISKKALRKNYQAITAALPAHVQLMPVIKSNAYGHGFLEVARTLPRRRRWGFVVAETAEALRLRQAFPWERILLLSNFDPQTIPELAAQQIDFALYTMAQFPYLARARRARVHVKVDTGTTRTGFRQETLPTVQRFLARHRAVRLAGIFSHLADSESENSAFTVLQIDAFRSALAELPGANFRHIACSAAAVRYPASLFDAARIGLALYGLWPSAATQKGALGTRLTPVLYLKSHIIQVKAVPKGTTIGYGRTYTVKRKGKVAVLPIGYADGFDRRLGNNADVLIRGRRAPVIGRICMNVTMVDVSRIPGVEEGDEVVLIGSQGQEHITAEELAARCHTINYEIVTRIRESLPRILV